MNTCIFGLFVWFINIVYGQDCSSLLGTSGKRFVFDSFYNAFNKLPSQVKDVLPANTEIDPRCRFDLLNMRSSQKQTLLALYNQGYAICVGCGFTDSDKGRCHSIDVCRKGSSCIQATNEDKYPSYYWHGCCDPSDYKCSTVTERLTFDLGFQDATLRYGKTVCQGPLCNENGYTSQKNDLVNFLTQNSAATSPVQTTVPTTPAPKIDGGWTEWSMWSSCDKSCDIGLRSRTRACTTPVPQNGGAYCAGKDVDSELCNLIPCV